MEKIALITTITVLFANILTVSFVFLQNRNNNLNRHFMLLTVAFEIWILGLTFSQFIEPLIGSPLFWLKVSFFGASLIPLSTYTFFSSFTNKKSFLRTYVVLIPLFLLFTSTSLIVRGYIGELPYAPIFGPMYYIFAIYFFILLSLSIISFLKTYVKSKGLLRSQIKVILFGTGVASLIGLVTNLFLPLMGINEFGFLGSLAVFFFLIFASYAIVKHSLMDIKAVVARSVTYLFLLTTILVIAGIFMTLLPNYVLGYEVLERYSLPIRSAIGVSLAFMFQPLKRLFTKATDKIFYKDDYDMGSLLKELTTSANATVILIELLYKTVDILLKKMKVTRGMFVLLDEKGVVYTSQSLRYKEIPKLINQDVQKFAKEDVTVFDLLKEGKKKSILRKLKASIALGIKDEEKSPVGILFLGEKESGDMYSAKDIRLFEILIPELALAIHRAKEHEKVMKFNITLQDEVKRQTLELENKNKRLRELDKAKDEFISMASHQLRTPLTAIKGYLSMLLEGDAGEIKMAQYDFVMEAYNGSSRMVGLINDLLNVSRMETGRFFIEPVEVDLEIMIEEELKLLSNHAKDKKLYLRFEPRKKKIPKVRADETKIRQVIMNFTDNAIYYTEKGGVTVSLDVEGKSIVYKVKDTGIGVPENQRKDLFTKFYRADNARRARPDGTGLGIYLAKKVVGDHEGELIFESKEGKGSTFGFKMPINPKFSKELTTPPSDLALKSQQKAAKKKKVKKVKTEKKEKSSALF